MFTREKLLKSPEYWFEGEQNEIFRQLTEYMDRENLNQSQLAERLKVSKGYISQILNGNFNFSLKKLIELGLSIGLIPQIKYEDIDSVIKKDEQTKIYMDFKSGGNIIPMNRITYNDYSEVYNDTITVDGQLGISA